MELQRTKKENEMLRAILADQNQKLADLNSEYEQIRRVAVRKADELMSAKQLHQRKIEELTEELSQVQESLEDAESLRDYAINDLHKKQKSFDKRKKVVANYFETVTRLTAQLNDMEKQANFKSQQITILTEEISTLNEKIAELNAKEVANEKEAQIKNKRLVESLRECQEESENKISTLNHELEFVRRLKKTTTQASIKAKNDLTKKLKETEEQLAAAKKEIRGYKIKQEEHELHIQTSEQKISELTAKNVKSNEVIQELQRKNENLEQFVDTVKNAMGLLNQGGGNVMENNARVGNDVGEHDDDVEMRDDDYGNAAKTCN